MNSSTQENARRLDVPTSSSSTSPLTGTIQEPTWNTPSVYQMNTSTQITTPRLEGSSISSSTPTSMTVAMDVVSRHLTRVVEQSIDDDTYTVVMRPRRRSKQQRAAAAKLAAKNRKKHFFRSQAATKRDEELRRRAGFSPHASPPNSVSSSSVPTPSSLLVSALPVPNLPPPFLHDHSTFNFVPTGRHTTYGEQLLLDSPLHSFSERVSRGFYHDPTTRFGLSRAEIQQLSAAELQSKRERRSRRANTKGTSKVVKLQRQRDSLDFRGKLDFDRARRIDFLERRLRRSSSGDLTHDTDTATLRASLAQLKRSQIVPSGTVMSGPLQFILWDPLQRRVVTRPPPYQPWAAGRETVKTASGTGVSNKRISRGAGKRAHTSSFVHAPRTKGQKSEAKSAKSRASHLRRSESREELGYHHDSFVRGAPPRRGDAMGFMVSKGYDPETMRSYMATTRVAPLVKSEPFQASLQAIHVRASSDKPPLFNSFTYQGPDSDTDSEIVRRPRKFSVDEDVPKHFLKHRFAHHVISTFEAYYLYGCQLSYVSDPNDPEYFNWGLLKASLLTYVKSVHLIWHPYSSGCLGHIAKQYVDLISPALYEFFQDCYNKLFTTTQGPRTYQSPLMLVGFLCYCGYQALAGESASTTLFDNVSSFLYRYRDFAKMTNPLVDVASMTGSLVSTFKWFLESATIAWADGTLEPFFVGTYIEWHQAAEELITERSFLGVTADSDAIDSYLERLEKCHARGNQFLISETGPGRKSIMDQVARLRRIMTSEELGSAVRSRHINPFYLGITGKPKCGKTHLLAQLAHIAAEARGEKYDPNRTFVWSMEDDYASGLKSTHSTIIVDDVGAVNSTVSADKALNPLMALMSFANAQSSATNQASLEDKGCIFAQPRFVPVTSNDGEFGASALMYKAAYLRRIRYKVLLTVRPEYRADGIDGSSDTEHAYAICPHKCASLAPGESPHEFRVVEYVLTCKDDPDNLTDRSGRLAFGDDVASIKERIILGSAVCGVDAPTFFRWFGNAVRDHHELTQKINSATKSAAVEPLCPICWTPSVRCQHADTAVQTQGGVVSFAKDFEDSIGAPVSGAPERVRSAATSVKKTLAGLKAYPARVLKSIHATLRRSAVAYIFGTLKVIKESVMGHLWDVLTPDVMDDVFAVVGIMATIYMVRPNETIAKSKSSYDVNVRLHAPSSGATTGYAPLVFPTSTTRATKSYTAQGDMDSRRWVDNMREQDLGSDADVYAYSPPVAFSAPIKTSSLKACALVALVKKNHCSLVFGHVRNGTFSGTYRGHGLLMRTTEIIFPGHFVGCHSAVKVVWAGKEYVLRFDQIGALRELSTDIAIIRVPPMFRTKYDLWDYVPTHLAEQSSVANGYFVVDPHPSVPAQAISMVSELGERVTDNLVNVLQPHDFWLAPGLDTARGQCGLPYVGETHKGGFLAGLHIGTCGPDSSSVKGMASAKVNAVAVQLIFGYSRLRDDDLNLRLTLPPLFDISNNGLGYVEDKPVSNSFSPKSYAMHRAERGPGPFPDCFQPICSIKFPAPKNSTKFSPTPLFGLIPRVEVCPPDFYIGTRDGVFTNPYNDAIDKFILRRSAAHPPLEHMAEATSIITADLARFVEDCLDPQDHPRPLTEHESLNGIDGVRYIDALVASTSAGLPIKGKKEELMSRDPVTGLKSWTTKMRSHVRGIAKALALHTNPGIFAELTLKDECKKPLKAIRGFAVLPAAYNDIMRRITLPLSRLFQLNPLDCDMAVGMNATGYMWGELAEKHSRFKNHFAWDFKGYDASHTSEMIILAGKVLFDLLSLLYRDQDFLICGYGWKEIFTGGFAILSKSLYVVQGTVYAADGTLPSGAWITTLINCIIQLIYTQGIWAVYVKEKASHERLASLRNTAACRRCHLAIDVYGDDGIASTNLDDYGYNLYHRVYQSWGITITPATKEISENPRDFIDFSEVDFLKRKFDYYLGSEDGGPVVLAPLALPSILKRLNYWSLPANCLESDHLYTLVESAGYDLSHHIYDASCDELWTKILSEAVLLYPDHAGLAALAQKTLMDLLDERRPALLISNAKPSRACLWKRLGYPSPAACYFGRILPWE